MVPIILHNYCFLYELWTVDLRNGNIAIDVIKESFEERTNI